MAKTQAVWGIDIGQCALKAMRCTWNDKELQLAVEAYDFIEYPKILSQPDADPQELVAEALEQFLSRNEVRGDQVAISVSGQVGLTRFFKPPPVDIKTLPKVVNFEAQQQIPFPLEEVIWDYQQIGGMAVDGLLVDAEVGIFAMKREAVFRSLQPYTDAEIEVDIVQLAPLSTYNFIVHEILDDVEDPEDIDPDNPPPSLVVLSIGTDTTDLVVSDGHKLWMRNIPIGGSHFTKQLSRDLKLTYAKAEHLKRNARKAEDPETVFKAMRPVFSDLVAEIQRSLNFFQGIEKNATIGKIAMLGNASKLPGLRQYLTKHLDTDIVKLGEFEKLSGEILEQPTFKNNLLSYNVCYGLCLQGLNQGRLNTNLLPREFTTARMIEAKKPWALTATGMVMLALAFCLLFQAGRAFKSDPRREVDGEFWPKAMDQVETVNQRSSSSSAAVNSAKSELETMRILLSEVDASTDGRRYWLELLSIINQTKPTDSKLPPGELVDPREVPFGDREIVYIKKVESQFFLDLAKWFNPALQEKYIADLSGSPLRPDAEGAQEGEPDAGESANDGSTLTGGQTYFKAGDPNTLQGKNGWVIQVDAYHLCNTRERVTNNLPVREVFVRDVWLDLMRSKKIKLPGCDEEFTLKELGIDFIVLAAIDRPKDVAMENLLHPKAIEKYKGNPTRATRQNATSDSDFYDEEGNLVKHFYPVRRVDFVIQFVWQPIGLTERLKIAEERNKVRAEAEAARIAEEEARKAAEENAG